VEGALGEAATGALDRLVATAPAAMDLTDPEQEAWGLAAAEALAEALPAAEDLSRLEHDLADSGLPVAVGLAIKLALSRALLVSLEQPAHLSVVLAVFKETRRMRTAQEHPDGEDFLRRKLAQLDWLFRETPHTWDLTVVDDGCPDGSGAMAREILEAENAMAVTRVLFLEEGIASASPPVRGLRSSHESRKGGSIRYGLWHAARTRRPRHVLLFTDADLSTHLGQCGLLMEPILRGGARAAIASRREPASVVVKQGGRNTRGKLFIYLWKRLVPQLAGITDTQCGFKAFRAEALEPWFESAIESGFAFDMELLIRVHLDHPGSLRKVAVAWVDSEALSTTTDLEPYLDMLGMVVRFYRAYLPPSEEADTFAELIDALDKEAFDALLEHIPEEIAQAEPMTFDDFDDITAVELARRAGLSA
jgi:hypothetical protein